MKSHLPSRRPSNRRISLWPCQLVLLLVANSNPVHAKMTDPPAPTISPAPSMSSAPSISPSLYPTEGPSMEPTSTPSMSSAPSPYETSAPSSNPTLAPTSGPTESPTQTLSIAPTQYVDNVRLPTIGLDVVVSDKESVSKSQKDLESDITAYIENLLESIADTFEYVALDFEVIRSSFLRRRLSTGLSIIIDGTAYFGSNPPSPEDLSTDLRNYFAVWGIEDMENYLKTIGLPSSQIASLTIEGDTVRPASGIVDYNPGASVQSPWPNGDGDTSVSPGVIAGLAAACTVLAAVLVYLLVKNCKRSNVSSRVSMAQSRRKLSRNGHNSRGDAPLSPSELSQTQLVQISDESDDCSGDDCISVDMSLYTTDDSIVKGLTTAKTYSYNPKRLDKVIELAKSQSNVSKERITI